MLYTHIHEATDGRTDGHMRTTERSESGAETEKAKQGGGGSKINIK